MFCVLCIKAKIIPRGDMIFVIGKKHRRRLEVKFGGTLDDREVICLNIPGDYKYWVPLFSICC